MRTPTFRLAALALALVLTLGLVGLASAQSLPLPRPGALLQATEAPTIDPDTPVALALGKASTTPLDNENVSYRTYSFAGKANQLIVVAAQLESGNMGLDVTVNSQNDVELGRANGNFLQSVSLTVKLPQDGKYKIRLGHVDPGSGDFEAGTASVMISEAKAAPAATVAK